MACHVSLTIELWTRKKDYDVGFRFSDYMLSDYLVDSVGIEFLSYETKSNSPWNCQLMRCLFRLRIISLP